MNVSAFQSLNELAEIARLPDPGRRDVDIEGEDPVIASQFRVGTAGAASIAATGVAAARLWKLKSGWQQQVIVNVRHAVAALRSTSYLRLDGERPPPVWDPLSGFFEVKDGRYVNLHCNFPLHRDAALRVLSVGPDRAAMAAAAASWEGEALEDAVHGAGGCAGFVRSHEEWAQHPQAHAVADQPLLEIVRIGDAPPEPLPEGRRPLSGVRVLDLTRVLAGPTCGRTLAEHGADVLKITAEHLADSGAVELDTGHGKLSARLDLRSPEGVERLRELVRTGDVFSQGYRPGTLAGRGFAPEDLAKLRPGIVCVSLSAWGTTGPWASRRGFDSIVQTVSGIADATGAGGPPRLLPVSAIDYVAGYLMAFGAMTALARRVEEGGSWLVRVNLARTGKWIVDRGLATPEELASSRGDVTEEELAPYLLESNGPAGRIGFLGPVVRMSSTPARWDRPAVPLGYHPAEWPQRE